MKNVLLGIATVAALPALVQAANIAITPTYVGSYNAADVSLGALDLSKAASRDPGYYHQFDLSFRLTNTAAGEDFFAVSWNVNLGAGLSEAGFGYGPASYLYDPPGPTPATNIYSSNSDLGASSTDLQALFAAVQNKTYANATQIGEASNAALGSIWVRFEPGYLGATSVSISPPPGAPFQTYTGNSGGAGVATAGSGSQFTGNSFAIAAVPEPTSIGLLGLAAGLGLRRRKR